MRRGVLYFISRICDFSGHKKFRFRGFFLVPRRGLCHEYPPASGFLDPDSATSMLRFTPHLVYRFRLSSPLLGYKILKSGTLSRSAL